MAAAARSIIQPDADTGNREQACMRAFLRSARELEDRAHATFPSYTRPYAAAAG